MTQDFARKQRTPQPKKTARKSPGTTRKKSPSKARSNTRRKPTKKPKAPTWAYGVIGLLLATLIVLLLYTVNNRQDNKAIATAPSSNTNHQTPQPRFDFYEILKDRKVEVQDRSGEIAAKTPQDLIYYLQAGSFRHSTDADELRAQLLLLNLEAKVEPGTSKGQTWHRVIVGPFKSRSKMAKARSTLASNNLSPLLLKRKTGN